LKQIVLHTRSFRSSWGTSWNHSPCCCINFPARDLGSMGENHCVTHIKGCLCARWYGGRVCSVINVGVKWASQNDQQSLKEQWQHTASKLRIIVKFALPRPARNNSYLLEKVIEFPILVFSTSSNFVHENRKPLEHYAWRYTAIFRMKLKRAAIVLFQSQ
jgi:hypothetical protein